MRFTSLAALVIVTTLVTLGGALAQDVERIQRARQLIFDGELDRAEAVLDSIGGEDLEVRSLRGLVAIERGDAATAVTLFESVLDERPNRLGVWLYLGQARYALADHEGALDALERGASAGAQLPGYFELRARVERELGKPRRAYETLAFGSERFPDADILWRERALMLIEIGLYETAMDVARRFLEVNLDDSNAWVVMGEALRRAGRLEDAAAVLEEGRLRFRRDATIIAQLAFVHASLENHLAAGRLFAEASRIESKSGEAHAFEVADQLRLARRYSEALAWNARVADDARRIPQRAAILVSSERYEAAVALLPRLEAMHLLDDGLRHHLAYACLKTDRPERARELARAITSASLTDDAERLLAAADACEARPWDCLD